MIQITDKAQCSGCTACASICGHKAIRMEPDALGFLYPKVDLSLCTNCGLCDKVCSFSTPKKREANYPISYIGRHKIDEEVLRSKSGAAFVALSDAVLKEGGVIYGAYLNEEFLVEHTSATTASERDRFRGSKYIQSNIGEVFIQVREHLRSNKKVLFSGTPCQVAGLKAFIHPKLQENLFLVDVLCHGVASPNIWKEHLKHIESNKKSKIVKCIPRDPKCGWDNSIDTFIFENGTKYRSDYFTGYIYHKWITQRWSCKECPFTSLDRPSDVTIGDAWGAEKIYPDFDKKNIGSSLILVNTAKGKLLFESARNEMIYQPVDLSKMMQPVLKQPTKFHPDRQKFEDAYLKHGYNYARIRYLNHTFATAKTFFIQLLIKIKHLLLK